ncbi:Uncharacterised protein [Mycobacterium tuberculosis]|nr:Uncharacterised protein [Mycobacterium tuberculosis]
MPRLAGTRAPGSRRLAAAQYTRLARLAVWTTFASTGSLAIAGLAAIVARSSSSIHSGLGLRAMRAPSRISSRIRGEGCCHATRRS